MPPSVFLAVISQPHSPFGSAVFLWCLAPLKAQSITLKNHVMYQSNDPVTFDSLPDAVSQLMKEVGEMKTMLQGIAARDAQPSKHWMSVDDLIMYLPGKPARQTIYSWVWKKAIPYHKAGAKLQFLKSEIDAWILGETFSVDDDEEIVRVPVKARSKKGGNP